MHDENYMQVQIKPHMHVSDDNFDEKTIENGESKTVLYICSFFQFSSLDTKSFKGPINNLDLSAFYICHRLTVIYYLYIVC